MTFEGIQGVQKPNRKRGAGPHSTAGREITVVMDFQSLFYLQIMQNCPGSRMHDLVNGLAILDPRVDHPESVLEEWGEIPTGKVTVFINCCGEG
jgi:hypothetical protein